MKRILLITIVVFLAFSLNAQDRNKTMSTNGSNISFTGTAGDTVTDVDSWAYQWNLAAKNKRQGYSLLLQLDSISGSPTGSAVLAGSRDNTTFTTITTISYTGFTTDTTFTFTDVATGVLYRYLRLTITGSGTHQTKINKIFGKIGDL